MRIALFGVLVSFVVACDDGSARIDSGSGVTTCEVPGIAEGGEALREGEEYPVPPVFVVVLSGSVGIGAVRLDDREELPLYAVSTEEERLLGGEAVEVRPVCGHEDMQIDIVPSRESRVELRVPDQVAEFGGSFSADWAISVCRSGEGCLETEQTQQGD